ncbi:MAG: RraA family protein [Gammaproteobacteria bacterium]|nr:RraA family protein [Gammaproteobacteria bacterium]
MNIIKTLYSLDTAELSDALDAIGIEGALFGISQITSDIKMVGRAYTIKYEAYTKMPLSFQNAGNYIDDVPEGSVLVIDNQARQDCTSWGDILTRMALLKKLSGTVVHGAIRDHEFIKNASYPVFASSIFMRSGKNRVYKAAEQCELVINGVSIHPGDFIVGDSNGVVCIPFANVIDVIEKAINIKNAEFNIISAIKEGKTLREAREQYRYDQPWMKNEEDVK